jgi:hypothetical protein
VPKWETRGTQTEHCQLCSNLVDNARLIEPDVEGLRGFKICDTHRFERIAAVNPSYNDMRAFSVPATAPEAGTRLEPIGLSPVWYEDNILLVGPDYDDWLLIGPGDLGTLEPL